MAPRGTTSTMILIGWDPKNRDSRNRVSLFRRRGKVTLTVYRFQGLSVSGIVRYLDSRVSITYAMAYGRGRPINYNGYTYINTRCGTAARLYFHLQTRVRVELQWRPASRVSCGQCRLPSAVQGPGCSEFLPLLSFSLFEITSVFTGLNWRRSRSLLCPLKRPSSLWDL